MNADLTIHARQIAVALLGEPNKELSTKGQLRFGSHGSLAVEVAGEKVGTFYDHEAKVGGGLLDLIRRERGCENGEAFDWLRSIGLDFDRKAERQRQEVIAHYVYHDRAGAPLFRVCRWRPNKTFTQERWDAASESWVTGKGCMTDVRRVPYQLHRLEDEEHVVIVEGEKDADALAERGIFATTSPAGAGKWSPGFAPYFRDKHVVIIPDHDQAGRDHARQVAECVMPVAASVKLLELPGLPDKGDTSDWLAAGGAVGQLREMISTAPAATEVLAAWSNGADQDSVASDDVVKLAALGPVEYDRVRHEAAKRLGVRTSTLDAEVEKLRSAAADTETDTEGKGQALALYVPEPWPEPVEGARLLGALVAQIQRFVILPPQSAVCAALWIIHAHAHDAAFHSPRLTLTSPTMRCGKSTMLRTVARLIPKPLTTANITPAALFRVVEAAKPSLLIDEADSFAHDNEELRGVVNSSHCRLDAFVVRAVAVGEDYEARRFSTWAPMAIASIGKVASTIADRSVMIPMERKAPGQKVERMRVDQDQGFKVLGQKVARWLQDNDHKLRDLDPDVPAALNDRQADNWRPLIAIADVAGGDWPQQARAAALALSETDEEADGIGVQLLGDIKEVLASAESIWTEELLRKLHAMTERPWCEYGRQRKPVSPRQLASLLKPFGITATQVWHEGANKRGYTAEQLSAPWNRYLSASPLDATESAAHSDFSSARGRDCLADEKPPKARVSASSSGLADRKPDSRLTEEF